MRSKALALNAKPDTIVTRETVMTQYCAQHGFYIVRADTMGPHFCPACIPLIEKTKREQRATTPHIAHGATEYIVKVMLKAHAIECARRDVEGNPEIAPAQEAAAMQLRYSFHHNRIQDEAIATLPPERDVSAWSTRAADRYTEQRNQDELDAIFTVITRESITMDAAALGTSRVVRTWKHDAFRALRSLTRIDKRAARDIDEATARDNGGELRNTNGELVATATPYDGFNMTEYDVTHYTNNHTTPVRYERAVTPKRERVFAYRMINGVCCAGVI